VIDVNDVISFEVGTKIIKHSLVGVLQYLLQVNMLEFCFYIKRG